MRMRASTKTIGGREASGLARACAAATVANVTPRPDLEGFVSL